ncbi:hypothetical protein Vafri_9811, partial [Volvox africanus]
DTSVAAAAGDGFGRSNGCGMIHRDASSRMGSGSGLRLLPFLLLPSAPPAGDFCLVSVPPDPPACLLTASPADVAAEDSIWVTERVPPLPLTAPPPSPAAADTSDGPIA